MSFKSDQSPVFSPLPYVQSEVFMDHMSEQDMIHLFYEILNNGIHGLCFSPYEEGQSPGDILTAEQIERRMSVIQPHISWVRSFSTTEGNEHIPAVAKARGINTLVGAWIGTDDEKNETEVKNLIKLAKDGLVDIAAVGNEVLYRNDLPVEKLLEWMQIVKAELPDIPVGYVDAYYHFPQHPEIVEASDVILANFYPFWEGTAFENSLQHLQYMLQRLKECAQGKKIIVTETGWPSEGSNTKSAEPGRVNAIKYFINAQLWSFDMGVEMFYFSSFDEAWKTGPEGNVGASWGIWDKYGKLKY